jgi:hypothetical protein
VVEDEDDSGTGAGHKGGTAAEDEDDNELSAGAKGGIAAGAVVVVLLVVGCAVWFYLKRRSRRHGKPLENTPVGTKPIYEPENFVDDRPKTVLEADSAGSPTGKTSYEHRVQLSRAAMPELSGDRIPAELSGQGKPAELEHVSEGR